MVFNSGFESKKLKASDDTHDKKLCRSKTSIRSQKSVEESANSKRPKSSSAPEIARGKKVLRVRPKTVEENNSKEQRRDRVNKSDFSRTASKSLIKYEKEEFSNTLSNKRLGQASCGNSKSISAPEKSKNLTALERGNHNFIGESWDPHRKLQRKQSEVLDSTKEKLNTNLSNKKPSEIPKLKPLAKGTSGIISQKIIKGPSKLPVKTKDFDDRQSDSNPETCKSKPESVRMALKSYRVKREAKLDEKIKEAMKDEFAFLIPLYESEFRKITEVWVNTLYCSLTMRTNLVKLLYQAFPQINRGQFQTEDETLLHYITHAKNHTKCEADNLLQFIRSLQGNRERAKEQYTSGMANREIAQIYNHDWKTLTRKISELGEESKQLQMEVPELQKKKAVFESTQNDKIREMQGDIEKKEQQLRKLTSQLNVLKEKEASYKKNVFLKIQDYNDIKADVSSLKSTEKEFEDLKATFLCQSEMYEKKIKEMEILLEEKKKVLEKEKEVKQKLQVFLNHLQSLSLGKEQVDYVLGRPNNSREKRREQLWLAAVQLVLRGFLIQMKKLEKDRNKMLLELQSNDSENFNAIATSLIKRENFIKTIKQQMNDFQKAFKYSKVKTIENSCFHGVKEIDQQNQIKI